MDIIRTSVVRTEEYAVDLEQALSVAGFGWYNIKYCIVQTLFLISAIVDVMGSSYILPSAKCDLNMTDLQRGLISSIPYIAVILTSFGWGYAVDTMGRERAVIYSSLVTGGLGIVAALMPDIISFAVLKFLSSLCVACPASAPYTIIGEIVPIKYKDLMLSITNAMQLLGVTIVPLVAWGILSLDFRVDFGAFHFRSWRLLSMLFSSLFIISAILMCFGPESPKYLMSQAKHEEALEVLQRIYAGNTNKSKTHYPIKKLHKYDDSKAQKTNFLNSLKKQSLPLLKPPYLKWLALEGFLLFGVFSVLNGLFMWVPDILNRVFNGHSNGMTACEVIALTLNETLDEIECDDTLHEMTFIIRAASSACNAVIALILSGSIKYIGKKTLTVVIYFTMGAFCFLSMFITKEIIFAVFLCGLQLCVVCVGPVNAFTIEIFPTKLRGMAVSAVIMIGRLGSATSTAVTGLMINNSCSATFYMFGGLLILCGLLTFLLPKANSICKDSKHMQNVSSSINVVTDKNIFERSHQYGDKTHVELKAYHLKEDIVL